MSIEAYSPSDLSKEQAAIKSEGKGTMGWTGAGDRKIGFLHRVAELVTKSGLGDYSTEEIEIISEDNDPIQGVKIYDSQHISLDIFWAIARWAENLTDSNVKELKNNERAIQQAITDYKSGKIQEEEKRKGQLEKQWEEKFLYED